MLEESFPRNDVFNEIMKYLKLRGNIIVDPLTSEQICLCHKRYFKPCQNIDDYMQQWDKLNEIHLNKSLIEEHYNGLIAILNMNCLMEKLKTNFINLKPNTTMNICDLVKDQMIDYKIPKLKVRNKIPNSLVTNNDNKGLYMDASRNGENNTEGVMNESDKTWQEFNEYIENNKNWPALKDEYDQLEMDFVMTDSLNECEHIEMDIRPENCVLFDYDNSMDIWDIDDIKLCDEQENYVNKLMMSGVSSGDDSIEWSETSSYDVGDNKKLFGSSEDSSYDDSDYECVAVKQVKTRGRKRQNSSYEKEDDDWIPDERTQKKIVRKKASKKATKKATKKTPKRAPKGKKVPKKK